MIRWKRKGDERGRRDEVFVNFSSPKGLALNKICIVCPPKAKKKKEKKRVWRYIPTENFDASSNFPKCGHEIHRILYIGIHISIYIQGGIYFPAKYTDRPSRWPPLKRAENWCFSSSSNFRCAYLLVEWTRSVLKSRENSNKMKSKKKKMRRRYTLVLLFLKVLRKSLLITFDGSALLMHM